MKEAKWKTIKNISFVTVAVKVVTDICD